MEKEHSLNYEILYLKKRLELTAREYEYNFKHPKVIRISQKLDNLILKKMKQRR